MRFSTHKPEEHLHVGKTLCLLCRQTANPGLLVLDLNNNKFVVPECPLPCLRCLDTRNPKLWTHILCFGLLKSSYGVAKPTLDDIRRFGNAVKPLYRPLDQEYIDTASSWEGLYSQHTRIILESSFRRELLERLPVEIQAMISRFIGPCWYLIVLGETRRLIEVLRNFRQCQLERLNLTKSKEIYISSIMYQGISYITNITNVLPLPWSQGTSGQKNVKLPAQVKSLVLSVDHIGVRSLQFVDEKPHPSADESPWYQTVDLVESGLNLRVTFDGLFIRNVQPPQGHVLDMTRVWSSPSPPKFQPWNIHSVRKGLRLDYVKLDDNSIKGLLVCCYHATNAGFYAFSGISKSFKRFVTSMVQGTKMKPIYWIFFPINIGESVEAAWVRRVKNIHELASSPILVIRTTFGRTATFGPHIPTELLRRYAFHPLVSGNDGVISGICHDGLDPERGQISEFGVTCDKSHRAGAITLEPPFERYDAPRIPRRTGSPTTTWYLTKAPLEGLLRVQICRDREHVLKPCIGLLLYYKCGRVESLGQFRWDQDISSEAFPPICVRKGNYNDNGYIIQDIQTASRCRNANERNGEWRELPQTGTITWWFGHLGDAITIYNY
ncbi:hypothetical protein MGYG_06103 [Nannizzia gypsea CBS 118893]|uniref:Uncharacterized protein n=1 Tax=Arthroderma gypseum (strain ATCC MYA-4604 / CBS 118893) TaxID=535722 RepID=E4V0H1_ARTGP|nr:hypothetical protein MGYG_06103 [Nannizzia gypsea CBS 118893]EFR03108.1 hypothetical protein MGYG_06103 [Nannizzia gypsea CBS 118893]